MHACAAPHRARSPRGRQKSSSASSAAQGASRSRDATSYDPDAAQRANDGRRLAAAEGYDDFETYAGPAPRLGWLLNMAPTTFQRGDRELSGVELFLLLSLIHI